MNNEFQKILAVLVDDDDLSVFFLSSFLSSIKNNINQ